MNEKNYPSMNDDIEVRTLFLLIWDRKWWICSVTIFFFVVAAALSFFMTPVYRASLVAIPTSDDTSNSMSSLLSQFGGIASLAGINVGKNDRTAEAIALINSRQFTERFISENRLMPRLFWRKWDVSRHNWRAGLRRAPTMWDAYKYFDRKIRSVSQDKKTNLVTLEIDWQDPQEAAAWANDIIKELNEQMREQEMAEADRSIEYLSKESTEAHQIELQQAINKLIEAQVKRRMLASVRQEFAFRVLDPAIVPELDDPIRPKPLLYITLAPAIGFVLATLFVIMLGLSGVISYRLDRKA